MRHHVFSAYGTPFTLNGERLPAQDMTSHPFCHILPPAVTLDCLLYIALRRRFPNCAPRRRGTFQNIVFSFNLCVLFILTATKLLGQTVINLPRPNYLIKGSVRYLFWRRGAVKYLLKQWGCREPRKFGDRCFML